MKDKNNENLEMKSAIDFTIDLIKKKNLKGDIVANQSKKLKLSSEKQELSDYTISSTGLLGVRVIDPKGRVGVAYSEALSTDSLSLMINQAQQAALISEPSEYQNLDDKDYNPSSIDATSSETYITESEEEFSLDKKIDMALSLEKDLLKLDKKIVNAPYNGLSEMEGEHFYANSLGRFCSQKGRAISIYSSALMQDDKKQSMYYQSRVGRKFSDLNIEQCLNAIYKKANDLLEGETVKTGRYDIIFDTDTLSSMVSAFSSMLSGKSAVLKMNPFADKIGEIIASEAFSLKDIPRFNANGFKGFNDDFFDDEGFERQSIDLIENGTLKSFYNNSATAKQLNMTNNYSASRSAKGHLSVGGTNKVISCGRESESDIKSGEYLYIFHLQGLHSGTNVISGDFSFGASGYLMRDGKMIQTVKGITLSGNFYSALKELRLSDELKSSHMQTFFAPTIRFKQLSIGGH